MADPVNSESHQQGDPTATVEVFRLEKEAESSTPIINSSGIRRNFLHSLSDDDDRDDANECNQDHFSTCSSSNGEDNEEMHAEDYRDVFAASPLTSDNSVEEYYANIPSGTNDKPIDDQRIEERPTRSDDIVENYIMGSHEMDTAPTPPPEAQSAPTSKPSVRRPLVPMSPRTEADTITEDGLFDANDIENFMFELSDDDDSRDESLDDSDLSHDDTAEHKDEVDEEEKENVVDEEEKAASLEEPLASVISPKQSSSILEIKNILTKYTESRINRDISETTTDAQNSSAASQGESDAGKEGSPEPSDESSRKRPSLNLVNYIPSDEANDPFLDVIQEGDDETTEKQEELHAPITANDADAASPPFSAHEEEIKVKADVTSDSDSIASKDTIELTSTEQARSVAADTTPSTSVEQSPIHEGEVKVDGIPDDALIDERASESTTEYSSSEQLPTIVNGSEDTIELSRNEESPPVVAKKTTEDNPLQGDEANPDDFSEGNDSTHVNASEDIAELSVSDQVPTIAAGTTLPASLEKSPVLDDEYKVNSARDYVSIDASASEDTARFSASEQVSTAAVDTTSPPSREDSYVQVEEDKVNSILDKASIDENASVDLIALSSDEELPNAVADTIPSPSPEDIKEEGVKADLSDKELPCASDEKMGASMRKDKEVIDEPNGKEVDQMIAADPSKITNESMINPDLVVELPDCPRSPPNAPNSILNICVSVAPLECCIPLNNAGEDVPNPVAEEIEAALNSKDIDHAFDSFALADSNTEDGPSEVFESTSVSESIDDEETPPVTAYSTDSSATVLVIADAEPIETMEVEKISNSNSSSTDDEKSTDKVITAALLTTDGVVGTTGSDDTEDGCSDHAPSEGEVVKSNSISDIRDDIAGVGGSAEENHISGEVSVATDEASQAHVDALVIGEDVGTNSAVALNGPILDVRKGTSNIEIIEVQNQENSCNFRKVPAAAEKAAAIAIFTDKKDVASNDAVFTSSLNLPPEEQLFKITISSSSELEKEASSRSTSPSAQFDGAVEPAATPAIDTDIKFMALLSVDKSYPIEEASAQLDDVVEPAPAPSIDADIKFMASLSVDKSSPLDEVAPRAAVESGEVNSVEISTVSDADQLPLDVKDEGSNDEADEEGASVSSSYGEVGQKTDTVNINVDEAKDILPAGEEVDEENQTTALTIDDSAEKITSEMLADVRHVRIDTQKQETIGYSENEDLNDGDKTIDTVKTAVVDEYLDDSHGAFQQSFSSDSAYSSVDLSETKQAEDEQMLDDGSNSQNSKKSGKFRSFLSKAFKKRRKKQKEPEKHDDYLTPEEAAEKAREIMRQAEQEYARLGKSAKAKEGQVDFAATDQGSAEVREDFGDDTTLKVSNQTSTNIAVEKFSEKQDDVLTKNPFEDDLCHNPFVEDYDFPPSSHQSYGNGGRQQSDGGHMNSLKEPSPLDPLMTHNPFEESSLDTATSRANEENFERNCSDRGDEAIKPKHALLLQENDDRSDAEVIIEENELDENQGGSLELVGSEESSLDTATRRANGENFERNCSDRGDEAIKPKHAPLLQEKDDRSDAEVTIEENELDENQGGSLELVGSEESSLDTATRRANGENFERNCSDRGDEAIEPKHAPLLQEKDDRSDAEVTIEENELDENQGGSLELVGSEGESESTKAASAVDEDSAISMDDLDNNARDASAEVLTSKDLPKQNEMELSDITSVVSMDDDIHSDQLQQMSDDKSARSVEKDAIVEVDTNENRDQQVQHTIEISTNEEAIGTVEKKISDNEVMNDQQFIHEEENHKQEEHKLEEAIVTSEAEEISDEYAKDNHRSIQVEGDGADAEMENAVMKDESIAETSSLGKALDDILDESEKFSADFSYDEAEGAEDKAESSISQVLASTSSISSTSSGFPHSQVHAGGNTSKYSADLQNFGADNYGSRVEIEMPDTIGHQLNSTSQRRSKQSPHQNPGQRLYVQGVESERKKAVNMKRIIQESQQGKRLNLATRSYSAPRPPSDGFKPSVYSRLYAISKDKSDHGDTPSKNNIVKPATSSRARARSTSRGQPVHERLYNLAKNKMDRMKEKTSNLRSQQRSQSASRSKPESTSDRLYNLAKRKRLIEDERRKLKKEQDEIATKPKTLELATRGYTPLRERSYPGGPSSSIHTRLFNLAQAKKDLLEHQKEKSKKFNYAQPILRGTGSPKQVAKGVERLYGRSLAMQMEGQKRREEIASRNQRRAPTPSKKIPVEQATGIYERGMMMKLNLEVKREDEGLMPYVSPLLNPLVVEDDEDYIITTRSRPVSQSRSRSNTPMRRGRSSTPISRSTSRGEGFVSAPRVVPRTRSRTPAFSRTPLPFQPDGVRSGSRIRTRSRLRAPPINNSTSFRSPSPKVIRSSPMNTSDPWQVSGPSVRDRSRTPQRAIRQSSMKEMLRKMEEDVNFYNTVKKAISQKEEMDKMRGNNFEDDLGDDYSSDRPSSAGSEIMQQLAAMSKSVEALEHFDEPDDMPSHQSPPRKDAQSLKTENGTQKTELESDASATASYHAASYKDELMSSQKYLVRPRSVDYCD